jgi:hypothetical protein
VSTKQKGSARSASTGRYVNRATAKRNPAGTVVEHGPNHSHGTHHRDAGTGRFIDPGTEARNPKTSLTERG